MSSDRLPRLLALVPYLMSHPGAEVPEVARLATAWFARTLVPPLPT